MSIRRMIAVVPCHNEERHLGDCLRSLSASARHLTSRRADVAIALVVVLDDCSDGSARIANAFAASLERTVGWTVTLAEIAARDVGTARSVGVESARALTATPPSSCWVLNTDADSTVTVGWMATHLAAADAGVDLLRGSVVLDERESSPLARMRWGRNHPALGDHHRIHGANLGVRLSAYDRAGGFSAGPFNEDVALVRRIESDPRTVVRATHRDPVTTSDRSVGRAPHGFATYMRRLDAVDHAPAPPQDRSAESAPRC